MISVTYANYVDVQWSINWLNAVSKVTNLLGEGACREKVCHLWDDAGTGSVQGFTGKEWGTRDGVISCCSNLRQDYGELDRESEDRYGSRNQKLLIVLGMVINANVGKQVMKT